MRSVKVFSSILIGLFFSATANAQSSSPAGVGQNNIIWLEANDLVGPLVDGFSWADKTSNGFDAVEIADGVNTPTIVTIGGQQYLSFAGLSGEQLIIPDDNATTNLLDGAAEFSVITVFNTGATDTRAIISKRLNSGTGNRSWSMFYNSGFDMFGYAGATTVGGSGSVAAAGNPHIATMTVDAALSGGSVKMFVNSAIEGVTGSNVSIPDRTEDIIIGTFNSGDTRYFNGDLAEIIVYRDALNGGERLVLENYLAQKYGIAITFDYFGNGANYVSSYEDDIRGIGTQNGTEKHASSGFSSGLQITELNNSLDAVNEFAIFAHDGSVSHADNLLTSLGEVEIDDRWQKDYYLEFTQNGTIDAASINTEFRFDFSEAGLPFTGSASDYVLLFRPTTADNFTRVFANNYLLQNGDQIVVNVPASRLQSGYYTLGRGDQLLARTWYSYTTGNWNNPNSWTLDGSSTPLLVNPSNEIPGPDDDVVITNGRTITMNINNVTIQSMEVIGRLVLANTTGHDFTTIDGSGFIRMVGDGSANDNFPDGTTTGANGFSNSDNGGTLEIRGSGINLNQAREFKNVVINMTNTTDNVVLLANYIINGDLTVQRGTLQINDNSATTSLTIDLFGDFNITANGNLRTGTANARHEFNLYSDFTNLGDARFSQRTTQNLGAEATNGIVDANFIAPDRDQEVNANGPTYFYRIEINKGVDDTYTLFLETNSSSNFVLTGPANYNLAGDVTTTNNNALGLIIGTVSVGLNVEVNPLNNTGNYSIGTNARLIVAGGSVAKIGGAAITPYGTIEVTSGILEVPSGSGITTRGAGQLIVTGGEVWISQLRTSIFGATAVGGYQQTGGTVNVWDYSAAESPFTGLAAGSASNSYARFCLTYEGNSFIMNGGVLNVKNATNSGLIFINSDPGNINVTGGTVNVYSNVANESEIASLAPFWNLNIINQTTSTSARITSQTLTCGPGGANNRTVTDPDLRILNDLRIQTGTTRSQTFGGDPQASIYGGYLDLCPNNNCVDLFVGRNLTIDDRAVLDVWAWDGTDNDGSATVTFNSSTNGTFYIGDITTYTNSLVQFRDPGNSGRTSSFDGQDGTMIYWELPLYNMDIDKAGATLFLSSKLPGKGQSPNNDESRYKNSSNGGKNVNQYATNLLKITNEIRLLNGTLNQVDPNSTVTITEDDGGSYGSVGDPVAYSIRVLGEITNQGTFFVYEDGVTPKEGVIVLRKDAGNVTLNTTAGSSFGNFRLLIAPDVVSITSDLQLGRLEISDGIMDIGTHNLKVDVLEYRAAAGTDAVGGGQKVYNENHYIRMAGNASDGGLSVKVPRSVSAIPDLDEYENLNTANLQNWNREYNQSNIIWFPIGTNASAVDKYTPAIVYLHNNGTTDGDEYITVKVVDNELQTTDLSGGDLLSYYWNVDYEGYSSGQEPTVSWLFQYDDADLDIGGGAEASFVPGKVLDGGAYTRSDDGGVTAVKDGGAATIEGNLLGNNPRNVIIFNGVGTNAAPAAADNIETATPALYNNASINAQWQNAWPNTGFTLENANYTAGVPNRFVGAPTIYYSRLTNNSDWYNREWDNGNYWSLVPHDGAADNAARPAAGTWPQAGDIAVIGFGGFTGGISPRHSIHIANGDNISVAEIQFNHPGNNGNRLIIYRNASLTFSKIGGTGGTFMERPNAGDAATISGDFGEFYSNNSFTYSYYLNTNGTYNIAPPTTIFPNLRIEGGNISRIAIFQEDILVNNNMTVDGNTVVRTNNGANGDIEVIGDLRIGGYLGGNFIFNDGAARTVKAGRLWFRNQGTCNMTVSNANLNGIIHRLIVNEDILQDRPGDFDLLNGTGVNDNNVILELGGTGAFSYTQTAGNTPSFYQIVMNKGSDTTSSFTIPTDFNIPDATASFQPIEIVNGILVLDGNYNGGSGILLANQSNFKLPNTDNSESTSGSGGLEIADGIVRIEGANTGLLLDGLLRVSGGNFDMEDGTNNNFIEYTSSGNTQIDVTGGTATIGGQIRRGITTTTGVLKYSQSAGSFSVGTQQADANPTRGVFEVLNSGSEFMLTGGDFILAGSNGSTTVPSLLLDPETHNVSGSKISISYSDGDDNFGIKSAIELDSLELTGSSTPTVKLYQLDLSLNGLLLINPNNTLDARGFDLIFPGGDFENNGTYLSSGNNSNQQTTLFNGSTAQEIRGSGSFGFYNFEKSNSGTLTASQDLLIENELRILQGTFATGSRAINVEGDVINTANHTSSVEAPGTLYGIVLSGNEKQILSGIGVNVNNISHFGVLAINNPEGALIQDGTQYTFEVNNKLILEQGVLDISSNLFILSEDAVIENENGDSERNDFEASNMVQTNSSFTDFGLRKRFTAGVATDFVFPVGQQIYTPIEVNMTAPLAGTSPSLTVRPANEPHPTIVGHDNSGANSPGTLDDGQNVLQYHWIVTSDGINSFTGELIMQYDPSDLAFLDPGNATASPLSFDARNYAAARLLSSAINWDKSFDGSSFDESNNEIIFDQANAFNGVGDNNITGDYTAGLLVEDDGSTPLDIGAIPNNVLEYETVNASGNYTNNTDWNGINGSPQLGIGETPNGAIIYIRSGDQMNLTNPNARIYRTVIESDGLLSIDENAINTRLGIVEGTGTIQIESNTPGQSPQLPAGYYEDFLSCSGGGLEYSGSVDYEVLANIPQVRRVIFSGANDRELPNSNLLICEDFIIRDAVSVSNAYNKQITIQRNLIKGDNGQIDFGTGSTILNGSSGTQQIAGSFTGTDAFYDLTINNANGVTIINSSLDAVNGIVADVNGDVEISNQLTLTNGLVSTNTNNSLTILLNASINNGSASAYVNGPLIRKINNDPSGIYSFPVGKSGRYALMAVANPTTSPGAKDWEVEYFSNSPPNPFVISSGSIEKVSENEYWSVSDGLFTSGTTQANIRLRWDANSDVTLTGNISDLTVAYYDGSGWNQVANNVSPSGTTTNGTLTGGPIPFSSRFITIATLDQSTTPLPVELISFTARAIGEEVSLEWETASEVNNERFEIQRTIDGENYEILGELKGAGTTTEPQHYTFLDTDPFVGINYYRLKQVDYDGAFEYSPIRAIHFERNGIINTNASNVKLYPNPNDGDIIYIDLVNWNLNSEIEISLYDISGSKQFEQLLKLNDQISFKGVLNLPGNLSPGLYFFELKGESKIESYKVIFR